MLQYINKEELIKDKSQKLIIVTSGIGGIFKSGTPIGEINLADTLINEKYISSLQHAGDMGIELCKAEIALKNNFKYIQDKDLNLK